MSPPLTETPVDRGNRPEGDAYQRALAALARLERGERDAFVEFQDALCRYVAALRVSGWSRDRAIESVRALVASPTGREGGSLSPSARAALVELSIHWCADEYALENANPPRSRPAE